MAYVIPYSEATYRPPSLVVPGNDDSDTPVEFDLVPAEGVDTARLKSLIYATAGISQENWTPEMQRTVIEALQSCRGLFDATVPVIRHLSVPYAMAVRMGVVDAPEPGKPAPARDAKVPILNGRAFTKVQGFFPALAFLAGCEIAKLMRTTDIDARFFAPGSGSLPKGGSPSEATGAANAVSPSNGDAGTAGSPA